MKLLHNIFENILLLQVLLKIYKEWHIWKDIRTSKMCHWLGWVFFYLFSLVFKHHPLAFHHHHCHISTTQNWKSNLKIALEFKGSKLVTSKNEEQQQCLVICHFKKRLKNLQVLIHFILFFRKFFLMYT
jgi:hypothetical protein